jgi:plastocyanin
VTVQLRSDGGNRFDPSALTVPVGTKVTWVWVDGFHNVNHDVTVGGNRTLARSGNPVNAPSSYAFTFTQPGTYTFFCEVHGSLTAGMRGSIEVR